MKKIIILMILGLCFSTVASATIDSTKHTLILAGIDSLTNGAGGSKYLDTLTPKLKEAYGDGGPGYTPFDYAFAAIEGFPMGYGAGVENISATKPGIYPAMYSLDNQGLHWKNAVNSYVDYLVKGSWTHGKVYYLTQPEGGTFTIAYLHDYKNSAIKVDTNGTLGIGVVTLPTNTDITKGQIAVRGITGKVVIYGGMFTNDKGVSVSRIGKGGDKLSNHASTVFRTQWMDLLQPSTLLLNAGMNDRGTSTADQYKTLVESYTQDYLDSGSSVVLISPNAIDGDNTRLLEYEEVLKQITDTTYISNRAVLGTYLNAKNQGDMLDGVHPNQTGNVKIANHLYSEYFTERIVEPLGERAEFIKKLQQILQYIQLLIIEYSN